jgi:hypothetical protein
MLENNINGIDIVKQPLQTFDLILTRNRKPGILASEKRKNKALLFRCILSEGGYIDDAESYSDKDVEAVALELLDRFHEMKNRENVSACYARLLNDDEMNWIQSSPWRPKIIKIFDDLFSDSLYKEWKLNPKLQGHEKALFLADITKKQEKDFHAALDSLVSLESVGKHRQKLLSCINNKTGQFLLRPFLPVSVETLLTDVYRFVQDYQEQKESISVMDAYTAAKEKIRQVSITLREFQTGYSHSIADIFDNNLLQIIEQNFSSNKAARPANIEIEAQSKKYPLHNIGGNINVGLVVKNMGPGYSYETELEIVCEDKIELDTEKINIGRLPPSDSQLIILSGVVAKSSDYFEFLISTQWVNFDGQKRNLDTKIHIDAQRTDVDWNALSLTDPYSLEPVENENQLVGRKEVLSKIMASIKAPNVGSFIIHGQKRVGKTSIAKVLKTQLDNQEYITVYLEAGDYVMPTATATVNRLGTVLCKKIAYLDDRAAHISIPNFDDAFSPITDFLDDLARLTQDKRVIIILDEFDRLPYDLYIKGPWGDSFFLTLRSITSRQNIGFIVIGGERIAHIIDSQGVHLNKWNMVPVDYFSRQFDWADYQELIQRPVSGFLDFTEDATLALHELTSGNPYFTKLICQYIFRNAISARDCDITRLEVDLAFERALKDTGKNAFQHFWDDRIFETGDKETEKTIRRRKILIAVCDVLQQHRPANGKDISMHPLVRDMASLESDLKEFLTRKVLIGSVVGKLDTHEYDFKVEFFYRWLKERGVQDIIASFSDLDAALLARQREEELKIQADEIVKLIDSWSTYRGQKITTDKVRAWLEQFPSIREQRLMFTVLKNLHFYSNSFVRSKMREIHDMVIRGLVREKERYQRKRSDIIVSYLDKIAKSGADYASLYVDEAEIYVDNVIEKPKLLEEIKNRNDLKAAIFIDDFVGSGVQAGTYLREIKDVLDEIKNRNLKAIFVAVVVTKEGWANVRETVDNLEIPVELHYCEILSEADQVFGEKSNVFPDTSEREEAKATALKYGKLLVKDNPLGYAAVGVGVVFERSCPNGTLPILWAENRTHGWIPLFKRL